MARYSRDPRARRPAPADRRAAGSNGQGSLEYTPLVGGLVACSRCAALVLDTAPARSLHGQFHDALRLLWGRLQ